MKKNISFGIIFLILSHLALVKGQVIITNISQTYNQDFTALTPVNIPWVNNFSLEGWFLTKETNSINALLVNDGSTSISDIYNFGLNADINRSLGALAAPDQSAFIGLRFTNATEFTINQINLSYVGKQWRRGNFAGTQTAQFFARLGGNDFTGDTNNIGWTPQVAFNFVSPQTNDFPAILNGNNPTNQVTISNSITSFFIAPGEEVWLRWFFPSQVQFSHGLAIDDITVTFNGFTNQSPPPPPPTNSALFLSDVKLTLKKPKLGKNLTFRSQNGFPIKGLISATTSVVTKASYAAFATTTNTPTNLVFSDAGLFKTKLPKKLAKKGFVALFKHKGPSNKSGIGIAPGTSSLTLIVKIEGTQGTNTGSAFFTNAFSTKVK